jgi:hypothetical protein
MEEHMAEPEYPPKSVKIALVLSAILWIGTIVGLAIHLPNIVEARPTNPPSTQTPAANAP